MSSEYRGLPWKKAQIDTPFQGVESKIGQLQEPIQEQQAKGLPQLAMGV